MIQPDFEDKERGVQLYCGDCLEILPHLSEINAVVTDPPYPNGEGHFNDNLDSARQFIGKCLPEKSIVFWDVCEHPECNRPLVAVHVWHRTNVNGKIWEAMLQYASDGIRRRSEVKAHAAVFDGVGPGCLEYCGHPTQKPIALMEWCLDKLKVKKGEVVLDAFMGSGTTGIACLRTGRRFIGIEIDRKYFQIAVDRIKRELAQLVLL